MFFVKKKTLLSFGHRKRNRDLASEYELFVQRANRALRTFAPESSNIIIIFKNNYKNKLKNISFS